MTEKFFSPEARVCVALNIAISYKDEDIHRRFAGNPIVRCPGLAIAGFYEVFESGKDRGKIVRTKHRKKLAPPNETWTNRK